MTDMIKRDDALAALTLGDTMTVLQNRIRALPAVDPAAIREAALREAAVACDIWPADEWHMHTKSGYIFAAKECQRNILALIGEKND